MSAPGVLLDRDGVINELAYFPDVGVTSVISRLKTYENEAI